VSAASLRLSGGAEENYVKPQSIPSPAENPAASPDAIQVLSAPDIKMCVAMWGWRSGRELSRYPIRISDPLRAVLTCIVALLSLSCLSRFVESNCLTLNNESVFQVSFLATKNYFIFTGVVFARKFTVLFNLLMAY
jgi:hypothetical protein